MKFKEFDTVKIMIDCEKCAKKGEIGAILVVFNEPREAYEVEILDKEGKPKEQCTLLPNELELIDNYNIEKA